MGIVPQRHGSVAELTLERPEVRNAWGAAEGRELRLGLEEQPADPAVGAVVISANGWPTPERWNLAIAADDARPAALGK